jgi:hypothetical protein
VFRSHLVACAHTYLHTYLLTPWCRILFEKLTVTHLVKKYPAFLWNPKVHHRVHKSPPPDPILSQPNPVRPIDPYLPKVQFNVILPTMPRSSQWSLALGPPNQNPVSTSPLPPERLYRTTIWEIFFVKTCNKIVFMLFLYSDPPIFATYPGLHKPLLLKTQQPGPCITIHKLHELPTRQQHLQFARLENNYFLKIISSKCLFSLSPVSTFGGVEGPDGAKR